MPATLLVGGAPNLVSPYAPSALARSWTSNASSKGRRNCQEVRKRRGLVANRLVEVTTRTQQERFLLRPSPEVNRIILGVIARAQKRTGMKICGLAVLSNHYHMLVVPESTKQLSDFMEYVNGLIARKVGTLHGWSGKFWHRPYSHIIVSDEPEAQIGRLRYLFSQGVKEGLVRDSADWPGVQSVGALSRGYAEMGGGVWRNQTGEYNAGRGGKDLNPEDFLSEETVILSPVPCLVDWPHRRRIELMVDLLRDISAVARRRRDETGKPPLGRKKILRQDPHSRPETSSSSPAPAFHAVSREHHEKLRELYREFVNAYREAAELLKYGVLDAVFPPGCFPPGLPYVPEARAGP